MLVRRGLWVVGAGCREQGCVLWGCGHRGQLSRRPAPLWPGRDYDLRTETDSLAKSRQGLVLPTAGISAMLHPAP